MESDRPRRPSWACGRRGGATRERGCGAAGAGVPRGARGAGAGAGAGGGAGGAAVRDAQDRRRLVVVVVEAPQGAEANPQIEVRFGCGGGTDRPRAPWWAVGLKALAVSAARQWALLMGGGARLGRRPPVRGR